MGSNTGLTSGRRKCKTATFRRKSAIPTIVRSARTIGTLDIVILELPWLSIIVDAWFVSVSFVAITQTPSLAEEPARRSYLAAGSWSGGGPRSRRRTGSCPAPSRGVGLPRNESTILLSEGDVCATENIVSCDPSLSTLSCYNRYAVRNSLISD